MAEASRASVQRAAEERRAIHARIGTESGRVLRNQDEMPDFGGAIDQWPRDVQDPTQARAQDTETQRVLKNQDEMPYLPSSDNWTPRDMPHPPQAQYQHPTPFNGWEHQNGNRNGNGTQQGFHHAPPPPPPSTTAAPQISDSQNALLSLFRKAKRDYDLNG